MNTYFTLITCEKDKYFPQFGDYSKAVVVAEQKTEYRADRSMIIATLDDQVSINKAVADINATIEAMINKSPMLTAVITDKGYRLTIDRVKRECKHCGCNGEFLRYRDQKSGRYFTFNPYSHKFQWIGDNSVENWIGQPRSGEWESLGETIAKFEGA